MIKGSFTIHIIDEDPFTLDFEAANEEGIREIAGVIGTQGCNYRKDGIWTYYPPHRIKKVEVPVHENSDLKYGYTINIGNRN